jgi:hypothetical protein
MSDFYERMQGVSSKLLNQFKQGTINYIIDGPATGPAYNLTPGLPVTHALDAVARGVEFKYIKEGYISASDIQVTAAVFDVEPTQSGRVSIDGREKQIIAVQQIPAAGVPVAWVIFCKS